MGKNKDEPYKEIAALKSLIVELEKKPKAKTVKGVDENWFAVKNVRAKQEGNAEGVDVVLQGSVPCTKDGRENWIPVKDAMAELNDRIVKALEKGRSVTAKLSPEGKGLVVDEVFIEYSS